MNNNTAINFRNPVLIRRAGMTVLKKELGTVGATYFMRQFNVGQGDYTSERDKLFQGISLEEIVKEVREIDACKA
ncbi:MAG: hypothetical protein FWG43_00655 [Clostridiales bacterium]|nr:hypothetical protein [Clostridiales bacterium]